MFRVRSADNFTLLSFTQWVNVELSTNPYAYWL